MLNVTYKKVGLGCALSKLLLQVLRRVRYKYDEGVKHQKIENDVQEINLVRKQTLQRRHKVYNKQKLHLRTDALVV